MRKPAIGDASSSGWISSTCVFDASTKHTRTPCSGRSNGSPITVAPSRLRYVSTDASIDGVAGEASVPLVSDDATAAQIFVPIDSSGEVREVVEQVRERVSADVPAGVEAWVTGPAGFTADLVKGFLGIDGLLLIVALGAVFVILVVVYRSPLLPLLVLPDSEKMTISVGLSQTAGAVGQNAILAGLTIASIPSIIVFFLFQRHIMAGLTAGGLKG